MVRTLLGLGALALAGCSVVPGDVALRSGYPEKAAKLYQSAARHGNADAALRLGTLIDTRQVSATVYGSAIKWFKQACDMGSLAGCHNVGVAYEYGTNGLPKDFVQARAYYLKAAVGGYMPSQYNLGSLYANNHVAPPNDVEGLKWILLAQKSATLDPTQPLAEWVRDDLPGNRKRLEMRLSDAQLEQAQAQADAWKAAGSDGR